VVVIKAQQYRSQEQNRADALDRLNALVQSVAAAAPHAPRHQAHLWLPAAAVAGQNPARRNQGVARQGARLNGMVSGWVGCMCDLWRDWLGLQNDVSVGGWIESLPDSFYIQGIH
jgi:hypothetical protein